VIETKRVGDFDAAVLRADDAQALERWLSSYGYASDAALSDWLEPYVKKGWFLTAFKIVNGSREQTAARASAVRMSFATDKPLFPYREPASQRDAKNPLPAQRLLRVYVLAGSRVEGTLGEGGGRWPGTTVWSGAMPKDEQDFLLYALRIHNKVKDQQWSLTEFEDVSSPRPGTDDVYFSRSGDPSPVTRLPITHYLIHYEDPPAPLSPAGAFALGAVSAAVLLALVRALVLRRMRRETAP
jgi:hypothetical protein